MATLLQFAQAENARDATALGSAQQRLANAQQAVAQAQSDLTAAAAALAALNAQAAAIRAQLAVTPMPADAHHLADELESLITQTRAQQAQVIAAQAAVVVDTAEADYATDAVARAAQRAGASAAALAAAQKEADTHSQWATALGQPPLSTMQADATAALGSQRHTDASNRLQNDVPAELLAHARNRGRRERERQARVEQSVTDAQDVLWAKLASDAGVEGAVTQKQSVYRRRESELREYVAGAKERFDRALAALDAVSAAPALTQEERDHIQDPAIADPGKQGVADEEALQAQQAVVAEKQAALDEARLEAIVADPDVDPATVQAVQDAQGELDTETQKLGPLQNAAAASKADLDRWEATVPDTTWALVAAFDEADVVLDYLEAFDAGALTNAMNGAASDLADALSAASKSDRARWRTQEEVKRRSELLAAEVRSGRDRVLSAIRGDG